MVEMIININEFKSDIARIINEANINGIPFAVIEPIMQDIMFQVRNMSTSEFEQAKQYKAEAEKQQQPA